MGLPSRAFDKFGPISDVFLPKDRDTGEPRGFGFVTFDDVRDAEDTHFAEVGLSKPVIAPLGDLVRRWTADTEEYELMMEDMGKPYWRRRTKVQWVGQWPVGDPRANPQVGGEKGLRSIQWFRGLRDDFNRKAPLYVTDWRDGLRSIACTARARRGAGPR